MIDRVHRSRRVVIVGGGIAGLAAAYELQPPGVPFVLLESWTRASAASSSAKRSTATRSTAGPMPCSIQKPEGIKLCQELGLGDRLVPTKLPRLAFIQRGGRLHALAGRVGARHPHRSGVRSSGRGCSRGLARLRMGAELFVPRAPRRRRRIDWRLHDAPIRRGSDDVPRRTAARRHPRRRRRPVCRFARCSRDSPKRKRSHGSLLRAFRRQPAAMRRRPDGAFKSLPGGLSDMVSALVGSASGRIRSACEHAGHANRQTTATRFRVETRPAIELRAGAVVVLTPAFAAVDDPARARRRSSPRSAARFPTRRRRRSPWRSRATRFAHPLNGSGFVVPRVEKTGIMAGIVALVEMAEPRARRPRAAARVSSAARAIRARSSRPTPSWSATAMRALRPLLGITGEPLLTRVYRWERANAQHEVGHLDRLAADRDAHC